MRYIDESGTDIPPPDLAAGYLVEDIVIKSDVIPIDNAEKFAYEDSDYEQVMRYVPHIQTVVEPTQAEKLASALSTAVSLDEVREAAKLIMEGSQ